MPCRRLSITTLPLPLTLTRGRNRDCDRMIRRAPRSRLKALFDRPTCALFPSALCEQLPQAFGRLEARRPHRQDACATTALSSLRMEAETDNCASALWVLSFASASSLFSLRRPCFPRLARNIRSVRCRKFRGNNPIQQRSGRMGQNNIRRDIRLQERRPKFRTKLVRQRRSHG
jgi:hypothetical protein